MAFTDLPALSGRVTRDLYRKCAVKGIPYRVVEMIVRIQRPLYRRLAHHAQRVHLRESGQLREAADLSLRAISRRVEKRPPLRRR